MGCSGSPPRPVPAHGLGRGGRRRCRANDRRQIPAARSALRTAATGYREGRTCNRNLPSRFPMKIPFAKLHGAKNDFLLTMVSDVPITDLQEVAIAICDRYTGVGADGWMLLDRTGGEDAAGRSFDASIRLFNSDGSEPELSGNGTRCAAALLAIAQPWKRDFNIWTAAGVKHLRLISRDVHCFQFEMNMGTVRIVERDANVQGRDAVIVNPGNPQCVFPVEDFDFDWRAVGAATERDPRFPDRTNVSFIRQVNRHAVEARFWERGA